MSRARLDLLRRPSGFRLLFLATLASGIGTWLAFVALVVDVFDRTRDATWVTALLVADFLPAIAIGLLAGYLIDRSSRRRLLVGSDLARAAVFCALPFAGSALQVVLLALAAGTAASVFRPTATAGLPNLVADADLIHANSLMQSAENLTWALGALAGGVIVAVSGTAGAYWLNAATFAVSALLILRIRDRLETERSSEDGERASRSGPWDELSKGLELVKRSHALLTVLIAWGLVMLASACVNVAEVVLVKDVFGAGDFGYGLTVASMAFGLVLGSLFGGRWIEAREPGTSYAVSIAIMALGVAAAAASPGLWLALVPVAVAGFGNGIATVSNVVLVQRAVPDQLRGRVFAALMSVHCAVLGLGMIAAGPLTNELGARAVWGMAAGLTAIGAVTAFALSCRVGRRAPATADYGTFVASDKAAFHRSRA